MNTDDLTKSVTIQLTAGHLLVVWDVLANKTSITGFLDSLGEEERRAIWALQDICERGLIDAGISSRQEPEWNALMEVAREHVKFIPVEFLE